MGSSYLDTTDILVIIPDAMRGTLPKNTNRMRFEGIEGNCIVQTDEGRGEGFRYRMCGMEFRGLVICEGANISRGAIEYLMTRMRKSPDKSIPWEFRLSDHYRNLLKIGVEERIEELKQHEPGFYRELSARTLLGFYTQAVGLDLSDIEYRYNAYIDKVGNTVLREYPARKSVMLCQSSDECSHHDMVEIPVDEIPKVIAVLERMMKLHETY